MSVPHALILFSFVILLFSFFLFISSFSFFLFSYNAFLLYLFLLISLFFLSLSFLVQSLSFCPSLSFFCLSSRLRFSSNLYFLIKITHAYAHTHANAQEKRERIPLLNILMFTGTIWSKPNGRIRRRHYQWNCAVLSQSVLSTSLKTRFEPGKRGERLQRETDRMKEGQGKEDLPPQALV